MKLISTKTAKGNYGTPVSYRGHQAYHAKVTTKKKRR